MVNNYFLDTYALFEIVEGNPNYKTFTKGHLATTRMNLLELHYGLLLRKGKVTANYWFSYFRPLCISFSDVTLQEASAFRLVHKKANVSFIDALGYAIARRRGAKFLTGDQAFKDLPNVEFVR